MQNHGPGRADGASSCRPGGMSGGCGACWGPGGRASGWLRETGLAAHGHWDPAGARACAELRAHPGPRCTVRSCCRVPGPVCQPCVSQFCGDWTGGVITGPGGGTLGGSAHPSRQARPTPTPHSLAGTLLGQGRRVHGDSGFRTSLQHCPQWSQRGSICKQAPMLSTAALKASGQGPAGPTAAGAPGPGSEAWA